MYQKFHEIYPNDLAGLYNLALMNEANERYKAAANYLTEYISKKPDSPNRAELEKYIQILKKDYRIFLNYMKEFLVSDLAYLNVHYQQLLYTPDAVPLAGEFGGFIREKYLFYRDLSQRLEIEETWLIQYSKEISQAFRQAIYFLDSNPQQWDLDGIAMLANIQYPLERLVGKIHEK